jgi:hypothetical protein
MPAGSCAGLDGVALGTTVVVDSVGVTTGDTRLVVGEGRMVCVAVGVSVGNVGVGESVEANATMLVGDKTGRCGGLNGLRNDWGFKKIAKYHRHVKIIKLMTKRVSPLYSS